MVRQLELARARTLRAEGAMTSNENSTPEQAHESAVASSDGSAATSVPSDPGASANAGAPDAKPQHDEAPASHAEARGADAADAFASTLEAPVAGEPPER